MPLHRFAAPDVNLLAPGAIGHVRGAGEHLRFAPLLSAIRDPVHSDLSRGFRAKRWSLLARRFPDLSQMTVLDLGGTEESWDLSPTRPARLVIVNHPEANADHKRNTLLGDACDPGLLAGERFDLVYSNSVIEHVGGHYRRRQFADTVRRLGEHHWVQTPYRFFPIEPHYIFPGLQFVPVTARAHATRWWPIGNFAGRPGVDGETAEWALGIELLSRTSMRHYFPDSEIVPERLGGLTKSLIAVA